MICAFCFFLARELDNELNLNLHSLSSKTSRYAHFGDNWLTVYGIRLTAFMLPLQQKFEFQNISFWNLDSRLYSRSLLPKIQLAACHSNG